MYQAPKCLSRRHEILDELLKDLAQYMAQNEPDDGSSCKDDVPHKVVCNLWNMIKEDPPCEGCEFTPPCNSEVSKSPDKKQSAATQKSQQRNTCVSKKGDNVQEQKEPGTCCVSESGKPITAYPFSSCKGPFQVYNQQIAKKVKSIDRNCELKIDYLMGHQNLILDQINDIEQREKAGIKLLQEADDMWTCMEEAYKEKIEESNQRQKEIEQQLKILEENTRKWKKIKKNLDFEMNKITKAKEDLTEKQTRKRIQLKTIDNDITQSERKITASAREIEATEKSLVSKRKHADTISENIATKLKDLSSGVNEEIKIKKEKETEGLKYINDARDDLQEIWRLLLKTKFDNEDLRAEKESIQNDISIMKTTNTDCKQRCNQKREIILDEIQKIEKDIANFQSRCSRCHQLVDTSEINKFCTDCPTCLKQRECLTRGTTCSRNPATECVCMEIKRRFMHNVLDNMKINLQKQVEDGSGTAVGEVVLQCLQRTQNGKVDVATKKILQDFILTTVRKNLNLTIVGGAMKTRCEMDEDTYKRLMHCIKATKVDQVETEDKSTIKKRPCKRWKEGVECNCPGGPQNCLCVRKAPQDAKHSSAKGCAVYPVSRAQRHDDSSFLTGGSRTKESSVGDTSVPYVTKRDDFLNEIAQWRPDHCKDKGCSGAWGVQDPIKLKPLFKKSTSSSQGQGSYSQSLCDSIRDSDAEHQQNVPNPNIKDEGNDSTRLNDSVSTAKKGNEKTKGAIRSDYTISHPEKSSFRHFKQMGPVRKHKAKRQKKSSKTPESKENDDVIELTRTPSGNPAMAFDEIMIQKINQKLDESVDMQVHIKKLDKDHFILEINSENNDNHDVAKVRKTPSGNLVMDAPKNIIETTDKMEKLSSTNSTVPDDQSEAVILCFKTEDGESTYVDGKITRSPSGKINVDLQNSLNLKYSFNEKVPIVECLTDSGSRKLDITSIAVKNQTLSQDVNMDCSANIGSTNAKDENAEPNLENQSKKISHELKHFENHDQHMKSTVNDSLVSKVTQNIDIKQKPKEVIVDSTQISQDAATASKPNSDSLKSFLNKVSKDLEYELSCLADNPYIFYQEESTTNIQLTKLAKVKGNSKDLFFRNICKKMIRESSFIDNHQFLNINKGIRINDNLIKPKTEKNNSFLKKFSNNTEHELDIYVDQPDYHSNAELQKIRVKGIFPNELFEPPAVLRRTPSGNYIFEMDKEYEKNCRTSLSQHIPCNDVRISVSKSGHCINIDLDDQKQEATSRGSLTTTLSGNLKLLIKDEDGLTQSKEPIKKYKMVGKNKINEAFDAILSKIYPENAEPDRVSELSNNETDLDLGDYIYDDDYFLIASSKSVKKTESGTYNLILDKHSKQKFIENIRIMVKNSHGIIPISRTDTGEIKIKLNQKDKSKDKEYLKVTLSGNIYLLASDETIECLTMKRDEAKTEMGSSKAENAEKAVGTFCNADCDHGCCEPGTCHCKELLRDLDKNYLVIDYKTSSLKSKHPVNFTHINNDIDNNKITNKSCNHNMDCDCAPRAYEQWLCMTEDPSLNWEKKHEVVANEFIDISNICDNGMAPSKISVPQEKSTDLLHDLFWKHIEDLPPLLPPFLRN